MKNIKLIIGFLLLFSIYTCSNSSEKNYEDDVVMGDFFPLDICQYDTESIEICIPESINLPQYADGDTILFSYGLDYRWNLSNLDSIKLLNCDTNRISNPCFSVIKDGKKQSLFFREYCVDSLHNSNYYVHSMEDFDKKAGQLFDNFTRQIINEVTPNMLNQVFHIGVMPSTSNPYLKDTVGTVRSVVRLVPPKKS